MRIRSATRRTSSRFFAVLDGLVLVVVEGDVAGEVEPARDLEAQSAEVGLEADVAELGVRGRRRSRPRAVGRRRSSSGASFHVEGRPGDLAALLPVALRRPDAAVVGDQRHRLPVGVLHGRLRLPPGRGAEAVARRCAGGRRGTASCERLDGHPRPARDADLERASSLRTALLRARSEPKNRGPDDRPCSRVTAVAARGQRRPELHVAVAEAVVGHGDLVVLPLNVVLDHGPDRASSRRAASSPSLARGRAALRRASSSSWRSSSVFAWGSSSQSGLLRAGPIPRRRGHTRARVCATPQGLSGWAQGASSWGWRGVLHRDSPPPGRVRGHLRDRARAGLAAVATTTPAEPPPRAPLTAQGAGRDHRPSSAACSRKAASVSSVTRTARGEIRSTGQAARRDPALHRSDAGVEARGDVAEPQQRRSVAERLGIRTVVHLAPPGRELRVVWVGARRPAAPWRGRCPRPARRMESWDRREEAGRRSVPRGLAR